MTKWRTVSIRSELVDDIKKLIELGRYSSVSEFVHEAIRFRLEEVFKSLKLCTFSPEEAPRSIVLAQKSC